MKIPVFALLLGSAAFFCSCKPETARPETPKTVSTKMDTVRMPAVSKEGASTYIVSGGELQWVGKDDGQLYGAVLRVAGGELKINQGYLLSGKVDFEMGSFTVNSGMPEAKRKAFETAVKGASFFNTGKHPLGTFTFKEVLPSQIEAFNAVLEGELTLKGKSELLNIPAKVTADASECSVGSVNFGLNTATWDLRLPGQKAGKATNNPESDNITLMLNLKAKPQ